jgi:cytosine/adenosine deaminase-related metal-dependent hydrolase
MELLLKNITDVDGQVVDKKITVKSDSKYREMTIDYSGHFLYPGLTNWHDHLEMNLYPKLGTPPYKNYTEWMKDIYKPKESPIKEIEKTDLDYRLTWGGLKNLISGVTTVYHHNPSKRVTRKDSFPVFVPEIDWAHSLAVEKKFRYNKDRPFIIHAAEGVDQFARQEIHQLDKLGLLKENTYIVHGIAVGAEEASIIKGPLVWCPSSNLYMFNKTANLKLFRKVLLGTDSTLTGAPTLLDEMRIASQFISRKEIFEMVKGEGFFVARKIDEDPIENLFKLHPKDISMVISRGRVRLENNKPVGVNVDKIKLHFERKVGSKILEQNPLWGLIGLCET